ncbi:Glycerate kinase [Pseudogulbenkiania ferrooxidans 2002]|uniref:Glycerate kinase n=2 Tax=Pseudogulbenkiania ferrooxidans TaxID=549169 RepID=B9Z670_9NEIS|nr:Glycerate kinase [Pseudogulbenkiania ferrooxidans 2002]
MSGSKLKPVQAVTAVGCSLTIVSEDKRMRWLIAPDSFKGSLAAREVAEAMARGIRRAEPSADCRLCPMADGGEGTLDALHATLGGEWHRASVHDAEGRPCEAEWLLLPHGVAVVEVARVVGLPDVGPASVHERDTRGVGELIRACLDAGARHIAVGLGGSSTNDGGAGCLVGLGVRLLDREGQTLAPLPDQLGRVAALDLSGLDARLEVTKLELWSDVDNPLLGPRGATAVFGPQKGVAPDAVARLDAAIARFAAAADHAFGQPCAELPGSGAAGGLGYALHLLGGRCHSGATALAELSGLSDAIAQVDWVLTGEGCSDGQTLAGKAPARVAELARAAGVPVSLLSGAVLPDAEGQLAAHFDGCFSLCSRPMTLEAAIQQAAPLLEQAAEQLARLVLAGRRGP